MVQPPFPTTPVLYAYYAKISGDVDLIKYISWYRHSGGKGIAESMQRCYNVFQSVVDITYFLIICKVPIALPFYFQKKQTLNASSNY